MNNYVVNNTVVRNGFNGVGLAGEAGNVYLVNNILSFNGTRTDTTTNKYGFWYGGTSPENVTLLNNLLVGNNGSITANSSQDMGNYSSIMDTADKGNLTTAGTEGEGATTAQSSFFDAIFVSSSPLNLHPASDSPAVDAGIPTYSRPDATAGVVPSQDFYWERRPKGGVVDIGADEKRD